MSRFTSPNLLSPMLAVSVLTRVAPALRPRLAGLSLAALGALPAAGFAAANLDTVTLNLTPLPSMSQEQQLKMDMRMSMKLTPPPNATEEVRAKAEQAQATMPLTLQSVMRQRLTTGPKRADGSYSLQADMESLKQEMRNAQGQVQALPKQPPMKFTATIRNDQFEAIHLDMPAVNGQQPQMRQDAMEKVFNQVFDWVRKFNGTTLKVGESVEFPLELALPMAPSNSAGKVMGRYTLTQLKQGVASFDVDIRMDMNLAVPVKADAASAASAPASDGAVTPPAAPPQAQATMKGTGQGTMDIRLADRLQLRSKVTMNMGMDMAGPDGSAIRMDMQMDMEGAGKTLPMKKAATPAKPTAKPATKG
ncbi:hypothetical protein CDN99_18235 [Roseateles aquatilis]|uniref:Uncharacterized protein n=1 Tax=Roseateles aquatilis TaxID=431061 RepID=A0A246J4N3_9BURK|nr:hypothetical protein [Roseateles aquatilis]OWQ87539.1 hypothetical protein CDN99_18235 [Roseateles aquatilis]